MRLFRHLVSRPSSRSGDPTVSPAGREDGRAAEAANWARANNRQPLESPPSDGADGAIAGPVAEPMAPEGMDDGTPAISGLDLHRRPVEIDVVPANAGEELPGPGPSLDPDPPRQPRVGRPPEIDVALQAFDSGDVEQARHTLEWAAASRALGPDELALLDLLLPHPAPLPIVDAVLRLNDETLTAQDRFIWQSRRFEAAGPDLPMVRDAALDLLAAATLAGSAAWERLRLPSIWPRIESAFSAPAERLDLMEQAFLAPDETGLPSQAAARAYLAGAEAVASGDLVTARSAERFLHLAGEPVLAYQIESSRKRSIRRPVLASPLHEQRSPSPGIRSVVIAGGHPRLRQLATDDLADLGLSDVRAFPSAWEANRQRRHARDLVADADLVVVVWRQIAHSTAEQVIAAARSVGVPLVRANTPTVSAIRRAVIEWTDAPRGDATVTGGKGVGP